MIAHALSLLCEPITAVPRAGMESLEIRDNHFTTVRTMRLADGFCIRT